MSRESRQAELELETLQLLARKTALFLTEVPDREGSDIFGFRVGGKPTFRRLIARGLVLETEEDLIDPEDPRMGRWTASYQLTDAGVEYLASVGG